MRGTEGRALARAASVIGLHAPAPFPPPQLSSQGLGRGENGRRLRGPTRERPMQNK